MRIIKNVSFLFCLLVAGSVSAQEFKPFKFNISLGYAAPVGQGASGGVLFSVEPKYGINDNIDLGLRAEGAIVASAIDVSGTGNNANGTAKVSGLGSYLLTGTYLFTTNNFRPYLGAGLGVYSVAGSTVTISNGSTNDDISLESSTQFGGMIRAGFKASHFNLGVEYNLIPNSKGLALSGRTVEGKNSYIGVKLGIDIGGGRL
jgi:outer membrane protein W